MGVDVRYNTPVDSLKALLDSKDFDAVFVGSGAPKGKELDLPGRATTPTSIHIGIEWLESIALRPHRLGRRARAHHRRRQHRDGLLPLGQAPGRHRREGHRAASRASTSRRRPGSSRTRKKSRSRSSRTMPPKRFVIENGKLTGMEFDKFTSTEANGKLMQEHVGTSRHPVRRRDPRHRPGQRVPVDRARHRHRVRRSGTCRWSTRPRSSRRRPGVFFGGDAAFGPENIIWAVEHGHQAAISIHKLLPGPAGHRAAAAGHEADQHQDGHARVGLQQRLQPGRSGRR